MMPEIHQQTQPIAGGAQVIQHLRTMLIHQFGNRLDLQNNLRVTDKIWLKSLAQWFAFVTQGQMRLRHEWEALQSQFNLQALLIHRFGEPAAFFIVNLKARPNDAVAFVLKNNVIHIFQRIAHESLELHE